MNESAAKLAFEAQALNALGTVSETDTKAVTGTLGMDRQERIIMLIILSVSAALILSATVTLIMWAQGDISFPVETPNPESEKVRIQDGVFVFKVAPG